MAFLTEWLTNIILFILLATILELLLPNSSMERYVKMVLGLLLLVMILNPLLSIFSKDVDAWFSDLKFHETISSSEVENSIEKKKIEILSGQRAYISEQVAVQMKRQVEGELMEQFDVALKDVVVSLDESVDPSVNIEEAIKGIKVYLSKEQIKPSDTIEVVQVISIDTSKEFVRKVNSYDDTPIQRHLADRWQIPKSNISLFWEGGEQ